MGQTTPAATFSFDTSSLNELRDILGASLTRALPGLELAARIYVSSVTHRAKTRALRNAATSEIARILKLVEKFDRALTGMSPAAFALLNEPAQPRTGTLADLQTPGRVPIKLLVKASVFALEAVPLLKALRAPLGRDYARYLLAMAVAQALFESGVELTKTRSAEYGRVLTTVFYAVDPDHAPQEFFRLIRFGVDTTRVRYGVPPASRGRRKRQ